MTNRTKEHKQKAILYFAASLLVTFGPMLFFVLKGFIEGSQVNKFTMGAMCVVSIILCLVNVITKKHLRSPLWILLLGVYFCLGKIETLLIILACTTVIDEFWLTPAYKHHKEKYTINNEIDKREEEKVNG